MHRAEHISIIGIYYECVKRKRETERERDANYEAPRRFIYCYDEHGMNARYIVHTHKQQTVNKTAYGFDFLWKASHGTRRLFNMYYNVCMHTKRQFYRHTHTKRERRRARNVKNLLVDMCV